MEKTTNSKVFIKIEFKDKSQFSFDVISHAETEAEYQAVICMITRGTLMVTNAIKATAYNQEFKLIAEYYK